MIQILYIPTLIEGFLPSRYWLPLPFCTQRLLHVLHVQHSLKHPINYPTCLAACRGGKLVACKACWHVAFRAPVGDATFHGTGVSWRQRPLCAAEMWTKPIAKWESTGGWSRRERGQNPKSQSVWPCVDWPNIDMEWQQQDLCLPTHTCILSQKSTMAHIWDGQITSFRFLWWFNPRSFERWFFHQWSTFFCCWAKLQQPNFQLYPGWNHWSRICLDMKKEVAFNDFWSNVDLIITTATRIFFDVGVQDPLVAPRGSPQY